MLSPEEFSRLAILDPKETKYFKVRFRRHISSVNADMQPQVMKEYIMRAIGSLNTQPVFVVTLENGRPLIVYSGEFEVLSVVEPNQVFAETMSI